MSGLSLERARASHEDIEVYERAIIGLLDEKPKTQKEKVWQQQRIAKLLERIRQRADELEQVYEDKDGLLKEDVATMRGRDAFTNFYTKLEQTREYHQKFPNLVVRHQPNVAEEAEPDVQFSGEEVFGKYLDLSGLHTRFYSLPNLDKVDYMTYLSNFTKLEAIPEQKKNATYGGYARDLYEYLSSFLQRTQPLLDLDEVVGNKAEEEFDAAWKEGRVPGWTPRAEGEAEMNGNGAVRHKPVDLSNIHTAEQLQALGMDRLKEGLMALGLKCGGTLEERAERLFSTKGKSLDQIDKKLFANAKKDNKGKGGVQANAGAGQRKVVALMEQKIRLLEQLLVDVIDATKRSVEKKQTRTVEEREAELKQEEEGGLPEVEQEIQEAEDDEEDEDGPIYNPLNLPLGYDGKPIPYWLYKLHGLNIEYKCEICGNFTYRGRRAFDRHFQEWRHAHGMRCLKIPNTKHFHDICSIEDAIALHGKIKDQIKDEVYDADAEEEFEDSEGNVLNRRTFEDLARQGLL